MKYLKFLTRKYTLLEHCLIDESLLKRNTSIPGIYYGLCVDVSRHGLADIYITQEDAERNKRWVIAQAKKDPGFVKKMLGEGLAANRRLTRLPLDLPKKIKTLSNAQSIKELLKLKQKFFDFSGYLDFTHWLGQSGLELDKQELKGFGQFHEARKEVFLNYFKFLRKLGQGIAKKKGVKLGNLDFLSFGEIIKLLEGKLSPKQADALQRQRKIRYIAKISNRGEQIITSGFAQEWAKIKKNILDVRVNKRKYNYIKKIIQKYGIYPAPKRAVTIFTFSCIASGYRKLLKKKVGFSYEAVGAIGGGEMGQALFNEKEVAQKMAGFIQKNSSLVPKVLDKNKSDFYSYKRKIIEAKKNPINFLKTVSGFYPQYMASLGTLSSFTRYLTENPKQTSLSQRIIKKIGRQREIVATFYSELEGMIKKSVSLVGKKYHFDGELLRYATINEMKGFLKWRRLSKKQLAELKKRKQEYLYLAFGNQEYVFTEGDIIKMVREEFFKIDAQTETIKGQPAYQGFAQGPVYAPKSDDLKGMKRGDILVISMTQPKHAPYLKKAAAIITDEGGILSHAAIISRELKIPCVIGTKIATHVLKNGMLIEINANQGVVKIIK